MSNVVSLHPDTVIEVNAPQQVGILADGSITIDTLDKGRFVVRFGNAASRADFAENACAALVEYAYSLDADVLAIQRIIDGLSS